MKLRNISILVALLVGLTGLTGIFPTGAQSEGPPLWQFSAKFTCGDMDEDNDPLGDSPS